MRKKHTDYDERTNPAFISGREVRVIPKGWQHPRNGRGRYTPLLPATTPSTTQNTRTAASPGCWTPSGLRVDETEIAAYETVSEGIPISPVFSNTLEGRLALVNHCAEHATTFGDHLADPEAWAAIHFGGAGVDLDGTVRT